MTDKLLTDTEIGGLIRENRPALSPLYADLDFARAVEAAVLAKVPQRIKPIYEMHPADATDAAKRALEDAGYVVVMTYSALGTKYVTECEARTRERAAYTSGYLSGRRGDTSAVNEYYPLPSCDKCGQVLP